MSGNTPYAPVDSDVSPALLPLAAQQAVSVSTSVSTSASGWATGDYKVSAQAADHDDVGGGRWLLCDSTSIDATYAALIALVGSNRPDARGRALVMKGTNAAVSTLLANDGVVVGDRRGLKHQHTPHHHSVSIPTWNAPGAINAIDNHNSIGSSAFTTDSVDGGSGTVTDPTDGGAFIVPGNLFIHT